MSESLPWRIAFVALSVALYFILESMLPTIDAIVLDFFLSYVFIWSFISNLEAELGTEWFQLWVNPSTVNPYKDLDFETVTEEEWIIAGTQRYQMAERMANLGKWSWHQRNQNRSK